MPCVYMATNTVNGKRYIGATKYTLKRRRAQHLHDYTCKIRSTHCPRFYAAIRKHGSGAFEWRIVKSFKIEADAFNYERHLIGTLRPEYNISLGRGDQTWCSRKVICLEDGRIFESLKSAARTYGTRSGNISAACRLAQQTTCNGRHFSYYTQALGEQERLDMIAAIECYAVTRRKKRTEPKPRNIRYAACSAINPLRRTRPVICVTTKKLFRSIAEAAEFYNVRGCLHIRHLQRVTKSQNGRRPCFSVCGNAAYGVNCL